MLLDSLIDIFTPYQFLMVAVGVFLGIVVGAIPGLSGSMLIALTVPITYYIAPEPAISLLIAMYVGSIAGGLISATLLRMPGTPSAVVTTLDAYPMARDGQPGRALGLGIAASFIGGLVAWVALATISKPLSVLALELSPFNYFALVMVALVMIASIGGRDLLKGLLSGFLGILVSMPGVDPSIGQLRLTFGIDSLASGFQLLPVLVGIFAVSQILSDALDMKRRASPDGQALRGLYLSLRDFVRHAVNLLRSSAIGTAIGILPGIGAAVGSMMAYSAARSASDHPERFGHGAEEGVIASEAGNSATVGGALVPLVALGIPGSVIDAILIGALMIHQIQPGPMLFTTHPEMIWNMIAANLVATVLMFVMMLGLTPYIVRLARVPVGMLLPVIMLFCVVGTFALNNLMFDVWVMLAFGAVGFLLERAGLNLAPFVIGFVLAPIAEQSLRQGLMITGGDIGPMFTDPITLLLFAAMIGLLAWPRFARRGRRVRSA